MSVKRSAARAVVVAIAALTLLPSGALATASLQAPRTARVESRITVAAHGLRPGRYTLVLAVTTLAPRGVPATVCLARIGAARTNSAGDVTISGTLPPRLGCHQAEGITEGHFATRPGRFVLTLGGFLPPAGFATSQSFLRRSIRLTR